MKLALILVASALGAVLLFGLRRFHRKTSGAGSGKDEGQRNGREELRRSLDALGTFLSHHQKFHWAKMLQDLRAELDDAAGPSRALSRLGEMFGGMGSLNDLTFPEVAVNEECARLLDAVFRDMKLFHGTNEHRAQWARLEEQFRDDLPPRIKHAFRPE